MNHRVAPPTSSDSASIHRGTIYSGFDFCVVGHYDLFRNPEAGRERILSLLEAMPITKKKKGKAHLFHGKKNDRYVYVAPTNGPATKEGLTPLVHGVNQQFMDMLPARERKVSPFPITVACLGYEPDLEAWLTDAISKNGVWVDVHIVDIFQAFPDIDLSPQFDVAIRFEDDDLVIDSFLSKNFMTKLSPEQRIMAENDWKSVVDSVLIDWCYDGEVMAPTLTDIPEKDGQVEGRYPIPPHATRICIKITDLNSESWQEEFERDPDPQGEMTCRVCGCTDTKFQQCVERTGHSCFMVTPTLCSACSQVSTYDAFVWSIAMRSEYIESVISHYQNMGLRAGVIVFDPDVQGSVSLFLPPSSDIELIRNGVNAAADMWKGMKDQYPQERSMLAIITEGVTLIEPQEVQHG